VFSKFLGKLGMCDIYAPTWGGVLKYWIVSVRLILSDIGLILSDIGLIISDIKLTLSDIKLTLSDSLMILSYPVKNVVVH
jgi:hypothetical protein